LTEEVVVAVAKC